MRDPKWRQDNPRDQLVVTIMAAQGHLLNIQHGHVKDLHRLPEVLAQLEDAQRLLRMVPEGTWTED